MSCSIGLRGQLVTIYDRLLRLLNIIVCIKIRWRLFEYYQFPSHLNFLKKTPSSRSRTSDLRITDALPTTVLRSTNWAIEGKMLKVIQIMFINKKNHIFILIFSMRSNYIMLKYSYNKEIENIHHFQWMFIKSCVADKVYHEICIHSDFLWNLQNHSIFAEKKLGIF